MMIYGNESLMDSIGFLTQSPATEAGPAFPQEAQEDDRGDAALPSRCLPDRIPRSPKEQKPGGPKAFEPTKGICGAETIKKTRYKKVVVPLPINRRPGISNNRIVNKKMH